jgi:hypothetical protein
MLGFGMCLSCRRFRPGTLAHPDATCPAFPNGIPDDITDGGYDHTEPYPGDGGVRFLPRDGVDVDALRARCAAWREAS